MTGIIEENIYNICVIMKSNFKRNGMYKIIVMTLRSSESVKHGKDCKNSN